MTTPAGWLPDSEGSGQPDPGSHTSKRKKWPWIVGAVAVFVIIVGAVSSPDGSSDDASRAQATTEPSAIASAPSTTKPTATEPSARPKAQATTVETVTPAPETVTLAPETVTVAPTVTVEPEPTAPARVEPATTGGMTGGQRNAVRAAEGYLDFAAFSRQGLIDQLEFEDYSTEDATFAVDYVSPDWNEQAALAAENYLEFSAFSRQGLIDQLIFEGYTSEQAQYGVAQTGI
ncbi:Ltp family lipoprotein [Rhodococcus sp. NPDC060090]|uniref:Ltp family lipoprotein n=1 Tax=Rhodococcus sp. NPDC060090 TaxID=3347056 RepID=UPI00366513DB